MVCGRSEGVFPVRLFNEHLVDHGVVVNAVKRFIFNSS